MKKFLFVLSLSLFVFGGIPNHQAVIITGDTPEGAHSKLIEAIVSGDTISPELWGFKQAKENLEKSGASIYEAFWYDTYLMWELFYTKGWSDANIHVLYGYGEDYYTENWRYKASSYGLEKITDHSAFYQDILEQFDSLKGVMDSNDNLFIYTFDHGGVAGEFSAINITDPYSPYISSKTHGPTAWEKVEVFGDYLYGIGRVGIYVIDISNPERIYVINANTEKRWIYDMDVDMNRNIGVSFNLNSTSRRYHLNFLDISNPLNPVYIDSIPVSLGYFKKEPSVELGKEFCYLAFDSTIMKIEQGTGIVDSFIDSSRIFYDIELYDDTLLFCANDSGLLAINTNPMDGIASINTKKLNSIFVKDLKNIYGVGDTIFYIFEMINDNIFIKGYWEGTKEMVLTDLIVETNYAYISDSSGYLIILDISNPTSPSLVYKDIVSKRGGDGITIKGDYVYFLGSNRNGYVEDSIVTLWLMDRPILDYDFASIVDSIQCDKRIFWMQQCHSGGFIDNLRNSKSIIVTASSYKTGAIPADNLDAVFEQETLKTFVNFVRAIENEHDPITNRTYYHGEFNFHMMNSVRKKKIYPYDNPEIDTIKNPDADSNGGTSMKEAYLYTYNRDSWRYPHIWGYPHISSPAAETTQYSDVGHIGDSTYLEWDDFAPPLIPSGGTYRYKRENDYNWGINLFWKKNSEVDFSGYNLYRDNNLIKKIYKDTSYLDFAMDLRGKPVMYKVSAFDLWGYESGRANIPLIYPIGISTYLNATGGNNGRRMTFSNGKIYAFYSSENKVYCITSSDTGKTWSLPEYIGDGKYPVCDRITNGIIALWVNGASIIYRLNRNGIWEDEDTLPPLYIFIIPEESVHGILPPSIKVSRDTVNIFAEFVIISLPGEVYRLEWNYGKFHIDNPDFAWEGVDRGPGYYPMPPKPKTLSPTITLKSNTPLLGYDKDGKIFYAQKQDTIWKRWEICAGYSPSIDYKYPYVYLSFVDASSKLRVISFVPPSDTILNFEEMDFKEDIYNAEEPFIIGNDYLLWCEYDTSEHLKVRYSTFNPDSFYWDEPLDLSHIEWGDALSPQGIMIKRWVGTKLEKRLIPIWAEGIEPDIGIKNAEILPIPYIFAMADLGKEIPSPFTIKREGFIDYSEGTGEPVKIVDYDPDTLIYRIEELNPDNEYTIRLGLYQKSNTRWKERVEIDQTPIGEKWLYPGEVLWIEKKIPNVDIQDGKIEIRVIKKSGEYAVLGALYLYEGDEAGATSYNNFISLKDGFYIRPVMNGIEMNIPYEEDVLLRIYDITGRCVSIPLDGRIRGEKRITLKELPIGIYFFNARIGNKEFKGKIVNVK